MTQAITPELLHEEDPLTPESVGAAIVELNRNVSALLENWVNPHAIVTEVVDNVAGLVEEVNALILEYPGEERVFYNTNRLNRLMIKTREVLVGFSSHRSETARNRALVGFYDFYKEMYSILLGDEGTQPLEPITDEQLTQD